MFDRIKWNNRFLELAKHVSSWSKDPTTKVGAVIVDPATNKVLGIGYNGFPRGVIDSEERYNNRDKKIKYVVHAEINAILNTSQSLDDCEIYIWPLFSCNDCAKAIIQSGIKYVYSPPVDYSKTGFSFNIASKMFEEAGVIHMEIKNV